MDSTEAIVADYLRKLGFVDVVFEPDGKVTPDFLVNGTVAIEVRRLSQTWKGEKGTEELETSAKALLRLVCSEALRVGPPLREASWLIFVRFGRPLLRLGKTQSLIREAVEKLSTLTVTERHKIVLYRGLELEVVPASERHETHFVFGGYSDNDSGGWVGAELMSSLNTALVEKSLKLRLRKSNYNVWWLVLVDRTGLGFTQDDAASIAGLISPTDEWNRVIVLKRTGEFAFEI